MIDSQVAAFAMAAAVLTVTPGQDTLLVVRNVLRSGSVAGAVTTLGVCTGLFVHAGLSAAGVSVVLTQSAAVFQVVKAAGAGYLAWLGVWSLARAIGRHEPSAAVPLAGAARVPTRRFFLEGFLSNALNPKTAVFYFAFLPQFISPSDPALAMAVVLVSIHFSEALVWLLLVSVAVERMRTLYTPTARRWLDGICGALFVALGARLALDRQ